MRMAKWRFYSCAVVGLLLLCTGCAARRISSSTDRKSDQAQPEYARTVVFDHTIVTFYCHMKDFGTEVCH